MSVERDPRLNVECFDCGHRQVGGVFITEAVRVPLIVFDKAKGEDKIKGETWKPWTLCARCYAKAEAHRDEQRVGEEADRRAKAAREAKEAAV